jgi:hypothetical protein
VDAGFYVIDVDGTLVTSDSDFEQGAAATYKKAFGFYPMMSGFIHKEVPDYFPDWMETVIGEHDAFAEQLIGEGFDRLGVGTPFRAEGGRAVADERVGDHTGLPAGLEDLGELGLDAGRFRRRRQRATRPPGS